MLPPNLHGLRAVPTEGLKLLLDPLCSLSGLCLLRLKDNLLCDELVPDLLLLMEELGLPSAVLLQQLRGRSQEQEDVRRKL